ncbi:MAG TPA: site-specific DNA-methyltransferase [Candidatus Binatia bacterium]|nr:site-specific DNA-methyltransferase [Candidatus Binatia bacterium]
MAIKARFAPYAECGPATLFRGDCLDLIASVPDGSVNLTVTSPPYNIGKEYEQSLPIEVYVRWCAEWLEEVHRVTADDGALWLNVGYCSMPDRGRAVPLAYLLWDKSPFHLIQEVVWHYGAGVSTRRAFSPRNEKFLWFVKSPDRYKFYLDRVRDPNVKYPNQRKNGRLRCNPLGKNPGDVWYIPKVTSGAGRASSERTPHPAQFPRAIVERIILACSDPGDTVLDPFIGSGTTAEAALLTDRNCTGFELRSDYLGIAAKRLRAAIRRKSAIDDQLYFADRK